jgi:hypothetical protein
MNEAIRIAPRSKAVRIHAMERTAIDRIIAVTEGMERFWRDSHGWAPAEAAALLASARLDRQTSFTRTLYDYLEPFSPEQSEAKLILGYASLRSLCEGVLKLFLAVWLKDYMADENAVRNPDGRIVPPEKFLFDRLIAFYTKRINADHQPFLRRVQQRGNAIHHFTDCDIETQDELIDDIAHFLDFLLAVNARLPYPDEIYDPSYA